MSTDLYFQKLTGSGRRLSVVRWLCIVLCCALTIPFLTASVSAVQVQQWNESGLRSGKKSVITELGSRVMVEPSVTKDEAAQRLYYLGLLSGTGVQDGRINFNLNKYLSRLESIVLVARLLGKETEILEENLPHPFTDVPEWGSPYVGYFYQMGMIENSSSRIFNPYGMVSAGSFVRYMFYALGYSLDFLYELGDSVGEFGIRAGICTALVPGITRGDAALMIFRTLNTNTLGSEKLLSEWMVSEQTLSYQDVLFLLWELDEEKTEAYIAMQGYTTEKVLADGKYTIALHSDSSRCLNVLVNGANEDYEGVGVTVWNRTDDISQKFRVERTESGTYRLYSCASGGGYSRVLGIGSYDTAALFSENSTYAGEYYICYSDEDDGTWTLIPVQDTTLALGAADTKNGSPVVLADRTGENDGVCRKWTFEFDGVVNAEGYEYALYPSDMLWVTQGAYDVYSHQKQNALDIYTRNGSVYAPFTGKIVRIDRGYSSYNTVWLQSCDKVLYADGTVDYMTVVFMHDNNVADLSVGQIVGQGEYFYDMGVAGGATGAHVHIACIRGQYRTGMTLTGSGDVYVDDALFLSGDVSVIADYGMDWTYID